MISFERGTVVVTYLLTIIYFKKKVKVETFKNNVVKSGFYPIRQSTIYYAGSLGRWDQASDVPSIIFFYGFLQNSLQKSFQFIFVFFFIKLQK